MMHWLQDIFFFMRIGLAVTTILPITIGGVFLGLAGSKIANTGLRIISIIGIVVIQLTLVGGCLVVFGNFQLLASLIPIWIEYPYLQIGALLFLWIPIIAQLCYVTKKPSPSLWMAGLIGLLAVVAGAIFFIIMAIVVGAQTD